MSDSPVKDEKDQGSKTLAQDTTVSPAQKTSRETESESRQISRQLSISSEYGGLTQDPAPPIRSDVKPDSALDDGPLPGFDNLVVEQALRLQGSLAIGALKHLHLGDVIQRRAKLLSHYLRLPDSTSSDQSIDWDIISADLQGYSEAIKRWNNFDRDAHHLVNLDTNKLSQLVAHSVATDLYEQKFEEGITDPKAVKEALGIERQNVLRQLHRYHQSASDFETPAERKAKEAAYATEDERRDREQERQRERYRAFWARFWMALFGGVALIVPMLIMSLHPSKTTSLATTSVFTFFVAIVLAWFMKTAETKDVIGATAAYVAVLVVFVGTATKGGSNSGGAGSHHQSGLSGGAIAGIVIGTLVGIVLLLMLLACCCFKGLVDGLLAIFGLGRRRRRGRELEEAYGGRLGSSYYSAHTTSRRSLERSLSNSPHESRSPDQRSLRATDNRKSPGLASDGK